MDADPTRQAEQFRLGRGQAAPESGAALDDEHDGAEGEAETEQLRADDLRETRPQLRSVRTMLPNEVN